jgi:CxxC-x17-CxxC domain-containing protein
MNQFNKGRRFGGRGDSRGRRDRDNGGRSQMHKAVCDECGENCEIPFRPTGDRPIYCSNCFSDKGGGNDRGFRDRNQGRRFDRDRRPRNDSHRERADYKSDFEQLNIKLDKIIRLMTTETVSEDKEKVKKTKKAEKKKVDTVALKKVVDKVTTKKLKTKKTTTKK